MDEWKREPAVPEPQKTEGWQEKLRFRGRKKEIFLLGLALLGLGALLWPQKEELSAAAPPAETGCSDVRQQLTEEVRTILSHIAGIGQVEVCLTLASDGLKEYALNQTQEESQVMEPASDGSGRREEKSTAQETDVAAFGGNALLVEEHAPRVVGVLVVAEGAENMLIRQQIADAVAVLLDVSPHRVRVLAGREEETANDD